MALMKNLAILAILLAVFAALVLMRAEAATTFDSPLPTPTATPHPPCLDGVTQDVCEALWADAPPPCDFSICTEGCIGIWCVHCEDLMCYATDQTYVPNVWGFIRPTTTLTPSIYLPLVAHGCNLVCLGRDCWCEQDE